MNRMKEIAQGALAGLLISIAVLFPSVMAFKAGLSWGTALACPTHPQEGNTDGA